MIVRLFYCSVVLLTLNIVTIFAQISGISNSKVVVPGAETVAVGVFEFEPAFESFASSSVWNSDGKLKKLDITTVESSHGFRFTTGVKENLEVGMILPSDVSSLNFGLKWLFWSRNDLSVALQSGLNFDVAIRTFQKEKGRGKIFGNGLVLTYVPDGNYSVDSDISISFYSKEIDGQSVGHSGTFDIGASYRFKKNFHGVAEYNFNWITFGDKKFDSKKGNGLAGFTFNANQSAKVIMGLKYDIHGSNNPKGVTYIAAFTFVI